MDLQQKYTTWGTTRIFVTIGYYSQTNNYSQSGIECTVYWTSGQPQITTETEVVYAEDIGGDAEGWPSVARPV